MSGGSFDYQDWRIDDIADKVEQEIVNSENGGVRQSEDCPYEFSTHVYSPEVIKELKRGLKILRQAYIYTHRIDYLLAGDDGEESFLRRLKKELNDVEETFTYKDDIQ